MKRLLVIVAATSLVACGGGAVLNPSNINIQAETAFCGVNVKFSDNPRPVTKSEVNEFNQYFGNFEKFNTTGLIVDKYQLSELVMCVCRENVMDRSLIRPVHNAINLKERSDDEFELLIYYEQDESSIKRRYQYIVPAADSSCQIVQLGKTPINSNYKPTFFDSVSSTKAKLNSSVNTTTKERLIQLDALKKDGLITQAEYESKKKVILDSL